jgi:cytidine deaminase
MTMEELMVKARAAAEFSYSPYSKFRVGAALLCKNGEVITGTNIENRSFGLTVCAERNAIATAIGRGITEFEALAVSCPDADYPVSPCGACRQVISEFTSDDFPIAFQGEEGEMVRRTMTELFPDNALNELKG